MTLVQKQKSKFEIEKTEELGSDLQTLPRNIFFWNQELDQMVYPTSFEINKHIYGNKSSKFRKTGKSLVKFPN
jgi:hypothetical protein